MDRTTRLPSDPAAPWARRGDAGVTDSASEQELGSRAPTRFLGDYLWEQKLLTL